MCSMLGALQARGTSSGSLSDLLRVSDKTLFAHEQTEAKFFAISSKGKTNDMKQTDKKVSNLIFVFVAKQLIELATKAKVAVKERLTAHFTYASKLKH